MGSKRKSQPLDQSWARSLGWSIEDGLGGACGAGSAAFECVAVGGGVCGLSLGDGLERSLSDPELAAAASAAGGPPGFLRHSNPSLRWGYRPAPGSKLQRAD